MRTTLLRLLPVVLTGVMLPLPRAHAVPVIGGRVGGLALVGPANAHPASMLHNPAALGLLESNYLSLGLTTDLKVGSVQRAPINVYTGEPSATGELKAYDEQSFVNPQWQTHIATNFALAANSVVIGLAFHNTWDSVSTLEGSETRYFDGSEQGANRYHGTDLLFAHLFTTLGASIRLAPRLHVGISLAYVHSEVEYGFVRDAALGGGSERAAGQYAALDDCGDGEPCNYESDRAAESIRVAGGGDGLAFGGGLVWRVTDTVDLGLGYRSSVVGFGGERVPASGTAWVRHSPASMDNAKSDGDLDVESEQNVSGRGQIIYQLPHIFVGGLAWRVTPRIAVDFQVSWILMQLHDTLDIRLSGTELRQVPQAPDRIVHYRGFRDMFGGQIGGSFMLAPNLELQAAALVQSSAVRSGAVSGTTIDNWKVDSFVALRWRVYGHFDLWSGYGLVWVPSLSVQESAFHPSSLVRCVDSQFDIVLDDCTEATAGRGMASTTGDYTQLMHRFSLGLNYSWR